MIQIVYKPSGQIVYKPSGLWFIVVIIARIKSSSIPVINSGKRVNDEEYIIDTKVVVVKRILMVNFIRCIRILMCNSIPLGAKYLVFLNCNCFKSNVIQHQATINNT